MKKALLKTRITDNVLEDYCHSEFNLTIVNNKILFAEKLDGIYSNNWFIGRTLAELSRWTEASYQLEHPQTFHEIYDPVNKCWRDNWSVEDIEDILQY